MLSTVNRPVSASADLARPTVRSVLSLTCLPVTELGASRLPGSLPSLIVVPSMEVAARATPPRATNRARKATASAGGLAQSVVPSSDCYPAHFAGVSALGEIRRKPRAGRAGYWEWTVLLNAAWQPDVARTWA